MSVYDECIQFSRKPFSVFAQFYDMDRSTINQPIRFIPIARPANQIHSNRSASQSDSFQSLGQPIRFIPIARPANQIHSNRSAIQSDSFQSLGQPIRFIPIARPANQIHSNRSAVVFVRSITVKFSISCIKFKV